MVTNFSYKFGKGVDFHDPPRNSQRCVPKQSKADKLRNATKKIKRRDKEIEKLKNLVKQMNETIKNSEKEQKKCLKEVTSEKKKKQKAEEKANIQRSKLNRLFDQRSKAKKRKSDFKEKIKEDKNKSEEIIKELNSEIKTKNKELTAMEQIIDELKESDIPAMENGRYSEEVRICALALLEQGFSARNVVQVYSVNFMSVGWSVFTFLTSGEDASIRDLLALI